MPTAKIKSSKYILVVDDLPDNLYLVRLVLEQEGHQVVTLSDGNAALAQIEKSPPSLILLDVMMPEIDGYEVTRRIRKNPNLPYIPILLVSAHQQSSAVEGLDAGADEFIRKPFQIDELQARVRSLLRLKETIDQRDNFVSCLTHDLRTPLVATDRMLSLVTKGCFGAITPQTEEALNNIMNSNHNLLAMLNNLLEVYDYEIGQKFLNFTSFPIGDLIQEIVAELCPVAEKKNLVLNLEQGNEINTIDGDRLELRRVLSHLINNGIKYTDQGGITVRLQQSPERKEMILIEVEDTGIGIDQDRQRQLFNRFLRSNHKRSGHGLGLNLSQKIIQSHQGQIEVESVKQKGTLFKIYLPIKHNG